jgi:hypothetical protein
VDDEMSRADDGGSATDVPIGARAYMRKAALVEDERKMMLGWEMGCGRARRLGGQEAGKLSEGRRATGDLPGVWQVAGA